MGKRAPPPPDYAATAREQATASRNITEQQTWANRPDQRTPFGNTTWSNTPEWDESTQQNLNRWTQTTTLDPRSQGALDSQLDLQRGRSDIAGSMLGRVGNELGSMMDWDQFQQGGQAPNAPNLQTGVNQQNVSPEQLQRGLDFSGAHQVGPAQFQQGLDFSGAHQVGPAQFQQGLDFSGAQQVGPEQLQRGLDFSGAQQIDPSQAYVQRAEGAINDRFSARNEPRFGREQANLETQLRNRGVKPGDEAYDRSLSDLRQGQNDAREQSQYQAIIGSGQEGSRMFGMDMNARQQQVNEAGQRGAFANQAATNQFGMGLNLRQQQTGELGQQGAFANQAAGSQFGSGLNLRQQQVGEAGQQGAFSNQAVGNQFGLGMNLRQQEVGELGQQGAFANQSAANQFGMGSSASGQNFSQGLQAAQFGNNAQQAGFGNQMQASNYQSQLRQQQIAEEMQQRGFSLNEVNALLTGQQVGMPSMPNFNTANRGDTPQLNQAAQNTYQAGLDSANSQNAFIGSLVGAAASPFKAGLPF